MLPAPLPVNSPSALTRPTSGIYFPQAFYPFFQMPLLPPGGFRSAPPFVLVDPSRTPAIHPISMGRYAPATQHYAPHSIRNSDFQQAVPFPTNSPGSLFSPHDSDFYITLRASGIWKGDLQIRNGEKDSQMSDLP